MDYFVYDMTLAGDVVLLLMGFAIFRKDCQARIMPLSLALLRVQGGSFFLVHG